jgi:hypothetical protein
MNALADQATEYITLHTSTLLHVGDLVEFVYNESADWTRPPRHVLSVVGGTAHLSPEETLAQAMHRWRREEKDAENARKQKHGTACIPQNIPRDPE